MKPPTSFGRLSPGVAPRASRVLLRAAACLVLAGCEACGSTGSPSASTSAASTPATSLPAAREPAARTSAVPPGGPAPDLRLRVESTLTNAMQLVIEVHGDARVALAPRVRVERQRDGEYVPLVRPEMNLRFDCDQAPADCLTLVPGAAFYPPPWSPDRGQCDCPDCATDGNEPGPFRFVVATCAEQHRVATDPWDPAAPR